MLNEDRSELVRAALGKIPCDLKLTHVQYLDVFTCEWKTGDLSIHKGRVIGTEPGLRAHRTMDGAGKWVVPGFIDAHVHVESSLLVPSYFEEAVLSKGTTSAVCDPHELTNVMGVNGLRYFLDSSEKLSMDLWVMMSSCVPATHLETNGGGKITAEHLLALAPHRRALGLAEVMNVPGVLNGDPEMFSKLDAFVGKPIDGHCPLLKGRELSAYATAGIQSCHESSELEEAREKLSKGISVWIREGSVAKDLEALSPLLTLATSTSVGFCTDDRNPYDIAMEGHLDHLVRGAIQKGVPASVAYRAASWSVARHYGLDREKTASGRVGAIAPGYRADLVVLDDRETCAIHGVLKNGIWATELPRSSKVEMPVKNTVLAKTPETNDLKGPEGQVHVIEVIEGKIITGRSVANSEDPGVHRLSVLERYGKGLCPSNAYVRGFGSQMRGAIASSVGHDSHNLIVVGDRTSDMRTALASLIEWGGGFVVVRDGKVLAGLPLPLGGLMSESRPSELKKQIERLKDASRAIGCELNEPFLQLAFLSLPVIPSLKLTDRGLVDVEKFQFIPVSV